MRDWNKRIYLSIFWILIGAALFGLGTFDIIDSFWGGMGSGLIAVGIVQTVRWCVIAVIPSSERNLTRAQMTKEIVFSRIRPGHGQDT